MIVCVFEHVQWRFVLNDRPAPRLGLIGAAELAAMKDDAILINTVRLAPPPCQAIYIVKNTDVLGI
jgi:hypothetical protein